MNRGRRSAFTLVELLVVITIIGMLMALLLPAVQAARESGRRTVCQNNQKQLVTAISAYESRMGKYPGYRNFLHNDPSDSSIHVVGSWFVMLLADMGMPQMWERWSDPSYTLAQKPTMNWDDMLTCPSDPRTAGADRSPNIAYVVNCGIQDAMHQVGTDYIGAWHKNGAAFGVFHNHDSRPGALEGNTAGVFVPPTEVSLDYISSHDGGTYTLLVSENISSGSWMDVGSLDVAGAQYAEKKMGMLWDPRHYPNSSTAPTPLEPPAINQDKEGNWPRPSSRHPGGVVAMFADSHYQFLSDGLDYTVWQHIMTPNGVRAGQTAGMTDGTNWVGIANPLNLLDPSRVR